MATVNTSRARRVERHPAPVPSPSMPEEAVRRARQERRRRERHFARRRRDLVQDVLLGLLLAIVMLSLTAGLAVVALIEVMVGLAVGGWVAVTRVRRWRARRQK